VTKAGHSAIVSTNGNEDCHVILRGGKAPNYDAASVEAARTIAAAGLAARSWSTSRTPTAASNTERQIEVAKDVAGQLAAGDERIIGVMVESHLKLKAARTSSPARTLEYGKSVTDACIGWEDV
jgi:3-deoxy-7-phosphoheptulonate synthase